MTPDDANLDFAKLLVPGVGLAPVTEFRVLITLFVLADRAGQLLGAEAVRPAAFVGADRSVRGGADDDGAVRLCDPVRRVWHDGSRAELSPRSTSGPAKPPVGRGSRTTPAWRRARG